MSWWSVPHRTYFQALTKIVDDNEKLSVWNLKYVYIVKYIEIIKFDIDENFN